MDLYVRAIREADFPVCAELLCPKLAYEGTDSAVLLRAWSRLLADQALSAVVAENRSTPHEPAVVGFAAAVFVSDAWALAARSSKEPYLTARTLAADAGPRSPILRGAAVNTANCGDGLTILNLHYVEDWRISSDQAMALRYEIMQAFIANFRGYRVCDVIQEFWDEIDPEFILKGWGAVRNDYAAWCHARGGTALPPGRRPYLIGLSREAAQANPGNVMAPVFLHVPARFGFTRAEKRLLRYALEGLTDSELASALGVAVSTVKSQWRAIYARLSRISTEFGNDVPESSSESGNRGPEKRRRLLDYLKRHPEELQLVLDGRRRAR